MKLTQEIERVLRAARDMRLAVRGLYGEGTEWFGNLFQISNQVTLGRTEQEGGSHHGWELLARQGMVAWLRAFASYAPVRSGAPSRAESQSAQQRPAFSAELTQVLTNMVLAKRN